MAQTEEQSDAAKREKEIAVFWKEKRIFETSLEKPSPNGEFVFYDGPPFATGLPHYGHLLASTIKDVIPRYKTMRGYSVRRRWGWDTHGLPIESLVEKKLGLKNKKDIVSLGIEKFNETARATVLEYVSDWKTYVERIGRFVDFDNSYKTMDPSFMESVWWGLKQIHEKGHLYEGRKVLMYCPHCETVLAKAEIAMDNTYKNITEESVTVKFKAKDPSKYGLPENTFILAWTTTPWTLPGNVALAIGSEIEYVVFEKDREHFVVAKERLAAVNEDVKVIATKKGSELVGVEYEPLYEIQKVTAHPGKKWVVLPANFVTTEEGTGIVHTAVIYGEDDYSLGLKEGLPMVPLLNPNATYNDDAPEFLRGQYIKKGEPLIKADLEKRNLLFSRAMNTHSYPHCYRCGTALIYNAVSSWFINIQAIKDKLLSENEKIRWVPDHLKHGRFERILETAPDWTISRSRFWATPLPIWKDSAGNVTVIGSLDELKAHTKKSGNKYFVMRHGEAEQNAQNIISSKADANFGLTELGKKEVQVTAQKAVTAAITHIYASPFLRTKESAEIMADALGISREKIRYDARLSELNFGDIDGGSFDDFLKYRKEHMQKYSDALPSGESYLDARRRFGDFLYEVDRVEKGNILIVSHGVAVESLLAIVTGADSKKSEHIIRDYKREYADLIELPFVPLPHNRDYELDYHLPYLDDVQLVNEKGDMLTRIPEVVDCWVESGSMPFAEYHYPFEHRDEFEKRTPGDFVSEYIGQTRAWFYYMHAMSVELFDHQSFKNVITTGNILAADGEKLSKSKGNFTDPAVLLDRFSADAFRYYMMSSVVMQAEDLMFRDEEVKEVQNRVVNMMRNVLAFYVLFKDEVRDVKGESVHVLDRWILARLNQLVQGVTVSLEAYDMPRATRPMRDFIDDLSTWYVRRSRDRVKGSDEQDKQHALATLRHVLMTLAKVVAPVMPYVAEELFQAINTDEVESVHLTAWPDMGTVDEILIDDMTRVRAIASEALMLRQRSGIKVRQPLAKLSIEGELSSELIELIADEINVKEVVSNASSMTLNTELTPELIREGDIREFMRALADARKERGLAPRDMVSITVDEKASDILRDASLSGVSKVSFGSTTGTQAELSIGSITFSIDAS